MNNPFKFGSIVDDPYFTNRKKEIAKVRSVLGSENHLILRSPRRYGKSSLIYYVLNRLGRPAIKIDLQMVTGPTDLAAQIMKGLFRIFPFEKIRQSIKNFRINPSVTINPANNNVEVSFQPGTSHEPALEDVLNLLEKLSTKRKKIIAVFDEFQEVTAIHPGLLALMRSVMQHHRKINYVFLGSQESMIREIFEKRNSPFYHFGMTLSLERIPEKEFLEYLCKGFAGLLKEPEKIAKEILEYTGCHPYYTQKLAFLAWENCRQSECTGNAVNDTIDELLLIHEMDYERLWMGMNSTDKKFLIGLSVTDIPPMSEAFSMKYNLGAPSTVYSSIKRLMQRGLVIKIKGSYRIDDPFFGKWIRQKRMGA